MKKIIYPFLLFPILLFSQTNYSLDFTRANSDIATITSSTQWNFGTNDFVIFIRAKIKTTDTENLLTKYQFSTDRWFFTYLGTDVMQFAIFTTGSGTDIIYTSNAVPGGYDSGWHSFIVYHDASNPNNSRLFYDGDSVALGTRTADTGQNRDNTGVLSMPQASSNDVKISKVALWKATTITFTQDMAQTLHNSGDDGLDFLSNSDDYTISSSLVAYYEILEGSGTTTEDIKGAEDFTFGASAPDWSTDAPTYTRSTDYENRYDKNSDYWRYKR